MLSTQLLYEAILSDSDGLPVADADGNLIITLEPTGICLTALADADGNLILDADGRLVLLCQSIDISGVSITPNPMAVGGAYLISVTAAIINNKGATTLAISTIQYTLNGQTVTLTYDSASGTYKGTATAPSATSWSQTNHVYNGQVVATDTAGNSTTATVDAFSALAVRVLETDKPSISVSYPAANAYITNSKPVIKWTVADTGSGVNADTIGLTIDSGSKITDSITKTAVTNGYTCTYTPTSALAEGAHTLKFDVTDNDGNAANTVSVACTVDTVPPTLNVSAPADGLVTNSATVTVSGTTNDATSSPVTVTVNGTAATVSTGNFSTSVTLAEGSNTITVIATDSAGKTTTITRTVTLDTKAPVIKAITVTPNPVNTGASYTITVTVED